MERYELGHMSHRQRCKFHAERVRFEEPAYAFLEELDSGLTPDEIGQELHGLRDTIKKVEAIVKLQTSDQFFKARFALLEVCTDARKLARLTPEGDNCAEVLAKVGRAAEAVVALCRRVNVDPTPHVTTALALKFSTGERVFNDPDDFGRYCRQDDDTQPKVAAGGFRPQAEAAIRRPCGPLRARVAIVLARSAGDSTGVGVCKFPDMGRGGNDTCGTGTQDEQSGDAGQVFAGPQLEQGKGAG